MIFLIVLLLPTYWCAPQFQLNVCEEPGCHVSDDSLDSALATFLCFTEEKLGPMEELEKKEKLAEKIVPRLLSKDGQEVQVDKLLNMDSDRLVELTNLVLHSRNNNPGWKMSEEQYLAQVIDGLVQKTNFSYSFFVKTSPHVLAFLNCEMQDNTDPDRDGRGAFVNTILGAIGLSATTTTAPATTAKPHTPSKWSYHGETGPLQWSTLFPDHCAGKSQSPINIVHDSATPTSLPTIQFANYDSITVANTEVLNNGHTLKLSAPGNTATMSGGPYLLDYEFLQFHLHWPSEHTIDGNQFVLEMHLVHKWSDVGLDGKGPLEVMNGLGVSGLLFEISADDNEALAPLVEVIPSLIEPESKTKLVKPISITDLITPAIIAGGLYSYPGSLTTPECNEVVRWTVFKTPLKISTKQMDAIKTLKCEDHKPLIDNYRPVQPLNDREVSIL